ncbi:tRNA lysidine(34) synthetase TilS [Lysobacter sp. GX 14042]|uniref:tRNA lysidine(34) synthetase TilS n=1 Tax=Lysobacter sp. GX 14042 TaxID=2907155 RepID=UPI001F1DE8E8|nr:tRNA lysidine(34) synthetase TilS [Lysobacter sp. GX 14042]MCE7033155.1 tRNA lysidine(34) synthetase TilS [Lysobacter sp. GX 14042]
MARLPPLSDAFHDFPDAPLLVGYSGGLDSTVLLHALARRAGTGRLRALHVDHGLQAESGDWAAHCRQACEALGVPLAIRRMDVRESGRGVEAAARDARHAALAAAMQPDEVLVLAHHRDDQAETFLLRALRGSGVDGLAAMRRWRGFGPGRLWRPLLDTGRDVLLAYAHAQRLRWVEDPGNAGVEFDRNYLRNAVLPALAGRWPHAAAALARSAALCAQASSLLSAHDHARLAEVRAGAPDRLSRQALLALDVPTRSRVLRAWVAALGLPPLPAGGLERLQRELIPARRDAEAAYRWQGAGIRAWRDVLQAGPFPPPLPAGWRQDWDGTGTCLLPGGDTLQLDPQVPQALPAMEVHARRGGERIRLPGRDHSHALKHVLQDLGIPPWERGCMPLLSTARGELLAAGDRILSATFSDWLERNGLRLHWHRAQGRGSVPPVD